MKNILQGALILTLILFTTCEEFTNFNNEYTCVNLNQTDYPAEWDERAFQTPKHRLLETNIPRHAPPSWLCPN